MQWPKLDLCHTSLPLLKLPTVLPCSAAKRASFACNSTHNGHIRPTAVHAGNWWLHDLHTQLIPAALEQANGQAKPCPACQALRPEPPHRHPCRVHPTLSMGAANLVSTTF